MLRARRRISKRWLGVFTVLLVSLASDSHANITTKFGPVYGCLQRTVKYGRERYATQYFNIPYAEPPIGDLRFKNPKPWSKHFTIMFPRFMPACVQLDNNMNVIGQEDCLYLNIIVPVISEKREESRALLPVLVYLDSGTRSRYHPLLTDYMMDQNVTLVVVQYRLNIFGFFGTGTKANPGNYGLKDVVMALRWIQENIGPFGGDPNSVTLWGHGEAASLVHMLALTKKTEGLFHRYIIQSATALWPMAVNAESRTRKIALATARSLDCLPRNDERNVTTARTNVTNEEEKEEVVVKEKMLNEEQEAAMMHCLRKVKEIKRFKKVMKYSKQRDWRSNRCCVFAPTIEEESDDAIVTVHPLTVMEHRLFRDIPFIMGVVHDEGLYKSIAILTNVTAGHELLNNFETNLLHVLEYSQLTSNVTEFARAIEDFYFDGNVSIGSLNRNITKVIGDALVFWPTYQTLKYQSDRMNSSTYFYLFSYESTFISTYDPGIPKHFGVSHADLNYLLPILDKNYDDQMLYNMRSDVTMINIMTEMWASFATKGVPEAWKVMPWPDYKECRRFLRLGAGKHTDIAEKSKFFPKRMAFWEGVTANLTFNLTELGFPQVFKKSSVPKQRSEMFICLTMFLAISFL